MPHRRRARAIGTSNLGTSKRLGETLQLLPGARTCTAQCRHWLSDSLAVGSPCTLTVFRMSTCLCFVYKAKLPGKVYVGCTQLALQDRLRSMKAKPVLWLRKVESLAGLKLTALHARRVPEQTALALEAAFAALAWSEDPAAARGGPYCLSRLHGPLLDELYALGTALEGQEQLYEKVAAVRKVARLFPRTGPLNRHLRGECYTCGGKFRQCSCRSQHYGLQVLQTPPKRRSGKSLSGAQKRSRKKWAATDPRYLKHKWGSDVETNRRNDAEKWNEKNPARDRGH